jgi:type I restriction enzyme, R subunit
MVFVIKKIRACDDLQDFKICLVNDRHDLEKQLGRTASLTGEKVSFIQSTGDLRKKLSTSASNLNMVMIHKFKEAQHPNVSGYLQNALGVPQYKSFGIINASERILLMVDEAHRTQSGDLGDNLFEAFPNSTRLAFTGTPLIITEKQKTVDRYGGYIDKYKLQNAVEDGATVQILYEGKTADSAVNEKYEFDQKIDALATSHVKGQLKKAGNVELLKKIAATENLVFEDLVKDRTDEEIVRIKQKWGTSGDIFEADKRIEAIAKDLVNHYIDNILLNGFKAQVVCSSKMAAIKYQKFIEQAIAQRLEAERAKPVHKADPEDFSDDDRTIYCDNDLCQRIEFLKTAVIVSSEGTNEAAVITDSRKRSKQIEAVANFLRPFDYENPEKKNTGVAFLIVCDMLLTGFDAPVEQVMYIDKKIKNHNLLQTIARVNRVYKGKSRGYVVDYVGLSKHLKEALSIYAAEDQKDILATLKDLSVEIPILDSRYQRLLNLFRENKVDQIKGFVEQTITPPDENVAILEQCIEAMKEIRPRANFEVYLKKFMQSMDIVLPNSAANFYKIPAKRFGLILMKIKERYKDDSLSISGAGEKVRKIIDEHLISLGINPKIPPVELFSPKFITEIEKNRTAKAKASEMEHAIRKHFKVNFEKDPGLYTKLSEKLEALIKAHKDNWDLLYKDLFELRKETEAGRKDAIEGVSPTAAPFYDQIALIAFGKSGIPKNHQPTIKKLVEDVIEKLHDTIDIINFWSNFPEVSKLRGAISDLILLTGIDELIENTEKIVTEITGLAKVRHQDIVGC